MGVGLQEQGMESDGMNKPMNINASAQYWQRAVKLAEHVVRVCQHVPSGGACSFCIAKVIAEEISAQSVEIAGGPKRGEPQ